MQLGTRARSPTPPEVLPWCDDPFISDPRVVTAVIDDQVLCALTLQVADDGMAVLMLPVHRHRNQKGHNMTVNRRQPPQGPFSGGNALWPSDSGRPPKAGNRLKRPAQAALTPPPTINTPTTLRMKMKICRW
jgi:hypothetical protein